MRRTDIKALRGMSDILPDEAGIWQFVENSAKVLLRQYGYEEIRTPILEEAALFTRSIGEESDIVQKQMYSFKDRGEREVALRPEGTASVVRAYLEHNLDKLSTVNKLYYLGPMFRNERPQAGRSRQFYQIGAEAFGSSSPLMDSEIICMMIKILESAGLLEAELKINSLGCDKDKKAFENSLKKALSGQLNCLCADCARRYEKNILRLFDCKNESCKQIFRTMPKIFDSLCRECKSDFDEIKNMLDNVGIKYTIAPFLVRGLDYYTGVVFEVTHKNLGSQDAVAAGGRYDNLVEELGGSKTPACGFAIGLERLIMAASGKIGVKEDKAELFLIGLGQAAQKAAFKILTALRNKGVACQMGIDEKSLKSQMRFADKINAKRVLIIGEAELKTGMAVLRDMQNKTQKEIRLEDVTDTHVW
jgi:histidyl-tRNA synthetase